ncbi:hypothetical protein KKA09_03270 [Patescibacteria group bacterium]|nr:hypothetical protein [Patescibacteria group bacterium]
MKKTQNNNLNEEQAKLSEEQIKELLKAQGRKLGFLVASANISDEEKAGFIKIIPEMSLEQVARLIKILETKYIGEKTQDIDKQFKKDLEEIKSKYEEKREELNKDTLDKLQKIAEKAKF